MGVIDVFARNQMARTHLPHAAACDFGSKFTHICITDPNRNMILCHRIGAQLTGVTRAIAIDRIDRLVTFVESKLSPILPPYSNREPICVLIEKQTPKNPICFALMYATIASIQSVILAKTHDPQIRSHVRIIDPKLKFPKLGIVADFKNKSHKLQMTKFVKNYLIEHNVKIQLFGHDARERAYANAGVTGARAHTRMRTQSRTQSRNGIADAVTHSTATNVESKIVEPCQLYTAEFVKNVKFDDIADCIGMILAHATD